MRILPPAPRSCSLAKTLTGGFRRLHLPRAGVNIHSPRVQAHCPDRTTSPERRQVASDSPLTVGTRYIGHKDLKPPVLRPSLTMPRLQTMDTLYWTSDTGGHRGRRFLWAPEPALRARGGGGTQGTDARGPGSHHPPSPGPCASPLVLETHLPSPTARSPQSPTCSGPQTRWPKHLPPSDCLPQLSRKRREDRLRPSQAGRLDKHSGPEGHSASSSEPWPAPPRPHAGLTDWALPLGPTRELETLQSH